MANTLTFANQTLTDTNLFGGINFTIDMNTGDEFSIGNTASACVSFTTDTQVPLYSKDSTNGTFTWTQDSTARGRFYVTEVTSDHGHYTVTAYDAMMLLETNISALSLSYPLTVSAAASAIATYIGCTTSGTINNSSMSVATLDANLTGRQLLSYVAEASGCSVKIDGSDHLCFMYYADSGTTLTASDYVDIEVADYTCSAISGVTILNLAGLVQATSGSGTNQLYISGNPFLEEATSTEAAAILSQVSGLVYTPLQCEMFDDSGIEAGTIATFGTAVTLVMHVDLNTESGASCSSVGSDTRSEYNRTFEDMLNNVLVIAREASDTAEQTIVTDTLHYLATNLSSGVTTSTPGWTTTVQSMTSTDKYLWTYHTYTKANGNSVNSNPVITGVYGDTGQNGTNGTDGSTIWTTTTAPTTPNYTFTKSNLSGPSGMTQKVGDLIVYSYYRYTITTVSTSTVKAGSRVSIRGSAGAAGASSKWYTGTAITGTSTTATTFPSSGITAAVVGDMYLNTQTGYTYRCTTAGDASTAKWVYESDITGPAGSNGVSITGVEPQYYLSDSSSSLTGGSWSNTLTYTSGKFIWTRDEISYSNSTMGYSTAVFNAVLTASASTDQYFWHVTSGGDAGAHITQIPKASFEATPTGGNTLITSTGMQIRDGMKVLVETSKDGFDAKTYDSGNNEVSIAHLGYGAVIVEGGTATEPYYTFGRRESGSSIGGYSVAEGQRQTASGDCSHAEGFYNTVSGHWAHAEGRNNTATGWSSHVEGSNSLAGGQASHAQNDHTKAAKDAQTAIGTYNIEDDSESSTTHPTGTYAYGKYAFIIGNGGAFIGRSNALAVTWDGDIEMYLGPNLFMGECSTAGDTYGKVATSENGDFTLTAGNIICVTFTYANTASGPRLSVDNTAAIYIFKNGSYAQSGAWGAGETVILQYDGSHYNILPGGTDVDVDLLKSIMSLGWASDVIV